MLKLRNVSKFYYNKGTVASGFTKINLDLNIGEFVAITGESGSGKSTLLNVISGLDSYEEGEMYINGEETSYYSEKDFEEYRKKYIANIFQNFNLINSYSVYQNIELVYLLNHTKDNDTKNKIEELLKKVNLLEYRNTPCSKLSGGQKQRVAIARALAKETPIIVADEPTGNLDSISAKEIIKLLHDVSADKLVVIVTHNYNQVEEYSTRKIKMHDGKILEDIQIKNTSISKYDLKKYGDITFKDKLKLSIRNTFNVIPKFLLLLIVYLFLTVSVIGEYTSNKKNSYDESFLGYNQFFGDYRDSRIVIRKKDKSIISEDDYNAINKLSNVDYIVKDDVLLDAIFSISNDNYYLNCRIDELKSINEVDAGRIPTSDDEVVLVGQKDDFYISNPSETLEKEAIIEYASGYESQMVPYKIKIVGIKYTISDNLFNFENRIYGSEKLISDIRKSINKNYSEIKININDNIIDTTIVPSEKISKGRVVIDDSLSYACKYSNCKNNKVNINIRNLYYEDEIELTISDTYIKNNLERLTGYKDYDKYAGLIIMNSEDYYSLFDKGNYQSSIFVKDVKKINDTIKEIESNGYTTLRVKDTLVDYSETIMVFVRLLQTFGVVLVLISLFFISYFIIKIILKSRNTYYSIIRMLGGSKKDIKMILNMELNTVLNISYIIAIVFVILINFNIINIPYIKDLIEYLKIIDYLILYIILFIISVIISNKYSKKLFSSSAMKTYREGK